MVIKYEEYEQALEEYKQKKLLEKSNLKKFSLLGISLLFT
jgi:hypothetical protein